MFRTTALAAALLLGGASTASAQFPGYPRPFPTNPGPFPQYPQPFPGYPRPVPFPDRDHDHHYHVRYRTCDHEPWQTYGTYHNHDRAHDIVRYLQRRGFEARVVHH